MAHRINDTLGNNFCQNEWDLMLVEIGHYFFLYSLRILYEKNLFELFFLLLKLFKLRKYSHKSICGSGKVTWWYTYWDQFLSGKSFHQEVHIQFEQNNQNLPSPKNFHKPNRLEPQTYHIRGHFVGGISLGPASDTLGMSMRIYCSRKIITLSTNVILMWPFMKIIENIKRNLSFPFFCQFRFSFCFRSAWHPTIYQVQFINFPFRPYFTFYQRTRWRLPNVTVDILCWCQERSPISLQRKGAMVKFLWLFSYACLWKTRKGASSWYPLAVDDYLKNTTEKKWSFNN